MITLNQLKWLPLITNKKLNLVSNQDIVNRVEDALSQMRPFFKADGGDMQLIEITDDMVAKIGLIGACSTCSMQAMSLRAGEEAIKKVAPEIQRVEAINIEAEAV